MSRVQLRFDKLYFAWKNFDKNDAGFTGSLVYFYVYSNLIECSVDKRQ